MRNGHRQRVETLSRYGLSAPMIARDIGIATNTVYAHRRAIRNRQRGPDHGGTKMETAQDLLAMIRRIQRKAEILELDFKAEQSLKRHDAREIAALAKRAEELLARL